MLVEGTLFAAGLVLTFAIGAPIASRAANPNGAWSWLRRPHTATPERPRVESKPGFTPLDLGPDPIQWPSQRPWPESPLGSQLWPSQTWDDEHFGSHWRRQSAANAPSTSSSTPASAGPGAARAGEAEAKFFRQESAAATSRGAQQASPKPTTAPITISSAAVSGPKPAAQQQQQQQQQKAQPKTAARSAQKPQAQRRQGAAPQASPTSLGGASAGASRPAPPAAAPPQAAPAPGLRANDVPTREELEAMVSSIGLAGTVQRIMERTGWDFRQSAQYLARVRQGS